MTTREELTKLLNDRFPNVWTKTSEEFDGTPNAIWTGEGSTIDTKEFGEVAAFSHHDESSYYEGGVYQTLQSFVEVHDWRFETQDPGTWLIFQN